MFDIIYDVLINTIIHLTLWVFPLFGLSMGMSNVAGRLQKMISRVFGVRSYMLLFGWPGTLVHELSHTVTGLIFGHKIENFNVYLLGGRNGKAGSVRLRHNPESYYQRLGNFFIAMAPIFGGAAVIYLTAVVLIPDLPAVPAVQSGSIWSFASEMNDYLLALRDTLIQLCKNNLKSTALFLYIAASVGSGMRMSVTDMKKTVPGCFILAGLFLLFHLLRHTIGEKIHIPVVLSESMIHIYTAIIAAMILNLILTAMFFVILKIRSAFSSKSR